MQVQVDIRFEQLLKIIKSLSLQQRKLLRVELEKASVEEKQVSDLEELLLKGPVATKKQLEIIEKNRSSINQWRKK